MSLWEEKAVVTVWAAEVWGHTGWEGQVTPGRKHWICSGAFSSGASLRPFSGVAVQGLSQSV